MTDTRGLSASGIGALRRSWAALHLHWRAIAARTGPRSLAGRRPAAHRGRVHKLVIGGAIAAGVAFVAVVGLWWRLGHGPLAMNMMTPWLTSAIEERFGGRHHVEVGGTQLERTEEGHTALRLRDIVVRDRDGALVARAPKAEVGISSGSLLTGHIRPQRLSLIGAAMAVRVEPDGRVTVFAGADSHPLAEAPLATASIRSRSVSRAAPPEPDHAPPAALLSGLAPLLSWLDGLEALGLDGQGLTEIGLKSGSITVDDRRSGKQWAFENIDLSLTRPKEGGIAFAIHSTGADGPWSLTASVTPRPGGQRAIEAAIRDVSPKDLALALRLGNGAIEANTPISAVLRGEIAADGTPLRAEARFLVGAGYVGDPNDPDARLLVDQAQFELRWDAANRQVLVPFELKSGGTQITLLGRVDPPRAQGAPWGFSIERGQVEVGPGDPREPKLVLDRLAVRGRFDPARRRLEVEQGDIGGAAASGAFSGALDYSGIEMRLAAGLAATPMSVRTMSRLWPPFVSPDLKNWIGEHVLGGTVERFVYAVNAPVNTLTPHGPPVPDDGLSIDMVTSGTVLQPFGALPAIRDGDLTAEVRGRHAIVRLGRGTAVIGSSGRKLVVSNGVFDVADTAPQLQWSTTRFRVEGTIDAAAELASLPPLREAAGLQVDPAASRGSFTAQIALGMPLRNDLPKGSVTYSVDADIANLAIERMVHGHKLEAAALRVGANAQGLHVKGDVRIGGTPAAIEYRKPAGDADAELRLQATLDDAARARFGNDLGGTITGPIALKLNGRIGSGDRESRFAVDADLGQAKISELLPGWTKSAGKPTRAAFVLVDRGRTSRFEDVVIEGSGAQVKGEVELDRDGEVVVANFRTFALSDGDKASLRAERASDGTMKVTMRGDVCDGRGFIKGAMAGPATEKGKHGPRDLDLDVKVGALAGFNGEALRGVELQLSRRAGQIRRFNLNAKLGRDGTLIGDLRGVNGRQLVHLETNDAGALFRFTDNYPKIFGGHMWVNMDPPAADLAPQDGQLHVRRFSVRGEPALERMAAAAPADPGSARSGGSSGGVDFTELQVRFTRSPGKLAIREGVVTGMALRANLEGQIDYTHDDVRMHGTFLPACALNCMPAELPFLNIFVGQNGGMFGVTYEVVGPPRAPILRYNPLSVFAPGIFRKPFEYGNPTDWAPQSNNAR